MNKNKKLNAAALKSIIIYFVIGILWILFSDSLLDLFVKSPIIRAEMQMLKGWFFITVTAILLYFLIRRYIEKIRDSALEKQIIEKQLDFYTKYANDIILLLNEEGQILEVNEKAYETYGLSKEELIGSSFTTLVADKNESFPGYYFDKIKKEKSLIFETIHINKNGSIFPVEVSAKVIETEGKFLMQGIIRDITERKAAEEQISILSRVVEQSPSSIIITNTQGNIEYVNPSFTKLTGYSNKEVLGKNPRILKSGENPANLYKEMWGNINNGLEWRGEIINRKKNGTLYWEYTLISPLRDKNNKITHFIAIKEDITKQKEMTEELVYAKEKAEDSDRLKSEFLAQMSHEIRTPLNVILSYNSLLNEELKNNVIDDLKPAFISIDKAGKRLLRTLNHILNMAAVQSGNFEVSLETVEVSGIIEHFIKEFEAKVKAKNLKFIYKKSAVETEVYSDEYILSEILQNLFDNAVKYTSQGSVTVEIGKNEESRLFVRVVDTGIGISEDYLPKLFNPFSQEDTGYSRRFEGNGLGLALVKNYVSFINAEITVSSKKGSGTEFALIFPNGKK